jgi:uncharacterized RDD family membrane protein YckC
MRFRDLKKQSQKTKQKQENIPLHVEARYVDRIKAFITDMFMIYVPILYILAYAVLDGKDAFQESSSAQFIGVTLYALIYALFLANSGQTPGKKAYTMKVVDSSTYKKISFIRALWRFISFLFSAMIGVGLLVPFFRKDNKTLHDLMAKTMVESIPEA